MMNIVPVIDKVSSVSTVSMEGINASFTQIVDGVYDVVLDISSQKFLIRFSDQSGSIDDFEVLSIQGFVYNLTSSLIKALKNLVDILRIGL